MERLQKIVKTVQLFICPCCSKVKRFGIWETLTCEELEKLKKNATDWEPYPHYCPYCLDALRHEEYEGGGTA